MFYGDIAARTLMESVAEGLIVIDGGGMIILANKRAEEIFGYGRDEVAGRSLSLLLPDRFVKLHAKYVENYFENPRIRPMGERPELMGRRKDGTEFPIDVSLSYLATDAGPLGMAFVTDITLRKQAETALKRRNEELDAFAHTVAHELNSTLGLLIGYSEFLVESHKSLSPSELQDFLAMIARHGRRMSSTIEQLLLFARIRQEDVVVHSLDMPQVVREALGRLDHIIEEHQAEILMPNSFPAAAGYAPWVENIWFNYISNALKYGGSPPRVELGADAGDNSYVRFWVKDNGAGLSAEQQAELFRPWTRLDPLHPKGHGLGLSIVQRIVEKLNGQVGVQSEAGQGSVFYFTLPGAQV
jgi:PAS domain S-box-containing protein